MSEEEATLIKRAKDADVLAWMVLTRRLFFEIAKTREIGFMKEQAQLAELELRDLKPANSSKAIHPQTMDMASDVIAQLLAGINITPR